MSLVALELCCDFRECEQTRSQVGTCACALADDIIRFDKTRGMAGTEWDTEEMGRVTLGLDSV